MGKYIVWIAAALLAPAAFAQSAIDGTWKTDLKSISGGDKPAKLVLKDGIYDCETCVPAYKVKADGNEQPVQGNPFFDAMKVKVVDDHTIEIASKKGTKPVSSGKVTVSADGNSMTREFTMTEPNGIVNKSTVKMARVGAPVKGAHAASGSWKLAAVEKMTDDSVNFRTTGGVLSMHATDGSSYEAKLGGAKAPVKGGAGVDAVSVRMKDKNTLEETDWRGDKVWMVNTLTVSADGKTARVTWEDKLRGTKGSHTMTKQ